MPRLPIGCMGTAGRVAPVNRQINHTHPLAHKLVWCAAPSIYGTREIVGKSPAGYVTGGGNRGSLSLKSRMGMAAGAASGTGEGVFWPYSPSLERITKKFTFVFWINKTNDSFSYIWAKNYDGITNWKVSLDVTYNAVNNSFDVRYFNNAGAQRKWLGPNNMYTGGSDGLAQIAMVRGDSGNMDFYRDGVYQGNDSEPDEAVHWNSRENVTMFTRCTYSPGDGSAGYIPLFMLFDGDLPKGDIISLYSQPFQMFEQNIGLLDIITANGINRGLFPFFMHSLRQ